jgi:hypothetical protein
MASDDQTLLDTLTNVLRVLAGAGLTDDDSLFVCELAWMAQASNLRMAALSFPDGLAAAQADQVRRLHAIADFVRADVPDLEQERLWHEGDREGYALHVLNRLKKGGA